MAVTGSAELNIDVAVLPARAGARGPADPHKVRLVILSGPDFRSPHLKQGIVCADRAAAVRVREQVLDALAAEAPRLEDGRVVATVPVLRDVPESGEFDG